VLTTSGLMFANQLVKLPIRVWWLLVGLLCLIACTQLILREECDEQVDRYLKANSGGARDVVASIEISPLSSFLQRPDKNEKMIISNRNDSRHKEGFLQ
jgi:hypothetical protein